MEAFISHQIFGFHAQQVFVHAGDVVAFHDFFSKADMLLKAEL
ncbi:Uncharacterised protein [Vibrio cholerae]|nr:Uncharacterised protein [Vibrio cholerae]CSA34586.1 Uncharacterised protein [Vibrio cholerae]CSA38553.1 Uncharacterised protein [Vibrio cholerae]CSA44029.1 Uncharacterised protein [Vibrio cholerae]CSA47506.1 Uncharacterised protein [Vibrio cholerae]